MKAFGIQRNNVYQTQASAMYLSSTTPLASMPCRSDVGGNLKQAQSPPCSAPLPRLNVPAGGNSDGKARTIHPPRSTARCNYVQLAPPTA